MVVCKDALCLKEINEEKLELTMSLGYFLLSKKV